MTEHGMDEASRAVARLLRVIHEIDWALPGPRLKLSTRYVGDERRYDSWAPGREDPFTATGLRDPALGNGGPIAFAGIEALSIHDTPRDHPVTPAYADKYAAASARMAGAPFITLGAHEIAFTRSGRP